MSHIEHAGERWWTYVKVNLRWWVTVGLSTFEYWKWCYPCQPKQVGVLMVLVVSCDRMKILVLWFHWGVLALVTLLKGISLIWRVAHWACGWKIVNVCESKFEMMGDCGFEHLWKLGSGAIHANPKKWGSWLSWFCLATGWKSLCCGFTEGCLPWWRCWKESR